MSTKDAYREKMEARLDEYRAKIAQLEARARRAKADAEIDYGKRIERLRSKEEEVRTKLAELRDAGEDAWEDVRDGVDRAWTDLKEAVEKAASRFD